MKKPEILAPAGSFVGLQAALAAGADAVYIGGNRFGARAYADNLTETSMIEAIQYCHLHGKKIYLTVNTLLKREELENDLVPYLLPYYETGLDAVIVQDVGVMAELHRHFPDLAVHASTQMSLTTGYGVRLCEEYGVTRLVPARELTLRELSVMRETTDKEIEVFVHGALCYCYSGQCLFSSMRGGRSGNRGRCAQPCRLPYQNTGDIGEYILSPKELCTVERIPELIEAGADSFKIEGRMKKPVYAALTTAIYRRYVDLYEELGKKGYREYIKSHKEQLEHDIGKLLELYNRNGFTKGYLDGKSGDMSAEYTAAGDMLSAGRPKHGGVYVGNVIKVEKNNTASVRLRKNIDKQDVLEFRDGKGNSLYEYTAGAAAAKGELVQARFLAGSRIYKGAFLYRTRKSDMIAKLEETYLQKLRIPITGKVAVQNGRPLEFTLVKKREVFSEEEKGENFTVTVYGGCAETANKRPITKEEVRKQMDKLGETDFVWERLDIICGEDCFVPVVELNNLRREGIRKLYEEIAHAFKRNVPAIKKHDAAPQQEAREIEKQGQKAGYEVTASVRTPEQLEAVLACEQVDNVYINMEDCSLARCKKMAEQTAVSGKRAYILLPHICRLETYRQLKEQLEDSDSLWYQGQLSGCVIKNMEELELFSSYKKELGEGFLLIADHNLYTWNLSAKEYWHEQGVGRMTAPLELTCGELEKLDIRDMELPVYGHIPLMVSAQCVFHNLYGCAKQKSGNISDKKKKQDFVFHDRKGHAYQVEKHCRYCYNTIYDREVYSLLGKKEQIMRLQPKSIRLAFTWEDAKETKAVLECLQGNPAQGWKHTTGHFCSGRQGVL